MKTKAIAAVLVLILVGFIVWCYQPSENTQTIGFTMTVPLPGLYSRCVSRLAEIATSDALAILTTESRTGSRATRNLAAQALSKTRWQPSNQAEQITFLIARGRYQEAVAMGPSAIPSLIEEFEGVDEPKVRSQLCAVLLKTGDQRAF